MQALSQIHIGFIIALFCLQLFCHNASLLNGNRHSKLNQVQVQTNSIDAFCQARIASLAPRPDWQYQATQLHLSSSLPWSLQVQSIPLPSLLLLADTADKKPLVKETSPSLCLPSLPPLFFCLLSY